MMTARRKVGVTFWTLAGLCFGMALAGFLAEDHKLGMAGMLGAAWFTFVACLPRRLFLKTIEKDDETV